MVTVLCRLVFALYLFLGLDHIEATSESLKSLNADEHKTGHGVADYATPQHRTRKLKKENSKKDKFYIDKNALMEQYPLKPLQRVEVGYEVNNSHTMDLRFNKFEIMQIFRRL